MSNKRNRLKPDSLQYVSNIFDLSAYTKNYLKTKLGKVKIYTKSEIRALELSRKKP